MGCPSDYLEPKSREKELQRAAKLLLYVLTKTNKKIPKWVSKEAKNIYASDERSITQLCAAIKALSKKKLETIVYNAHNETSRKKADAEHEKEEKEEMKRKKLKKSALSKLSPEERRAIDAD